MIEDQKMHQLFKAESTEHLARLDEGLLRLEKMPADQPLLEEVFREAHSLKGSAHMLGLAEIEVAAHGLESILNAARKGETPLTPETIEQMNGALGKLRHRVQAALAGEPLPAPTASVAAPHPPSPFGEPVALAPAAPHATPPPAPAPAAAPAITPDVAHTVAPAVTPAVVAPAGVSEPFRIETVRVETRKLDDLLTQVGVLSVIRGRARHRRALMEELLQQWAALERAGRKLGPGSSTRQGAASEAPGRFGNLLKQARAAIFADSARLESTVNLLEDQVRSIRLLPLSTVFALFPRLVRDLAREQGKEAELILEGGDLTVDKRILEEMKDPLMHLIRNALDHGIELPAERGRRGKPRQGTVLLRARRENASLLLEVADDGCGLDPAKIRQEAKKRGLLNAECGMQSAELKTPNSAFGNPHSDEAALAAMATSQLQQLIFKAGFSTSAYVTELSGRGVGLDVVRVNVERMKGSIRLESAPGHGLTVQLRLPLCLATTRILLANVGGRPYGLPVEFVLTSRRVRGEDIFTLEGHPAVLLDGQPVIVARLQDLLELPAGERAAAPDTLACIVIQAGDERLGLLADELLAEEEVVPKPLGPPLKRVRNVSALAMLGSGEICPVLNPTDLLRTGRTRNAECGVRSEDSIPPSAFRTPQSKPTVLLAEDSALIRAMEKRILEDGGYEVVTAVDGVEALNALGSRHFAAVVSDIVMPNMDGLALAAHIRAEPRYHDLPVILVTSLASDEDKRRGLDVGANAYIPKPSFDQRILLDTLKRLI